MTLRVVGAVVALLGVGTGGFLAGFATARELYEAPPEPTTEAWAMIICTSEENGCDHADLVREREFSMLNATASPEVDLGYAISAIYVTAAAATQSAQLVEALRRRNRFGSAAVPVWDITRDGRSVIKRSY